MLILLLFGYRYIKRNNKKPSEECISMIGRNGKLVAVEYHLTIVCNRKRLTVGQTRIHRLTRNQLFKNCLVEFTIYLARIVNQLTSQHCTIISTLVG